MHQKTIFAPRLLHKYPHMSAKDIPVWIRFLELHAYKFTGFQYDVALGKGNPVPNHYDAAMAHCAKILSQKRVDAVGFMTNETWIIEVKPVATLSAVGQAAGYSALYSNENQNMPNIRAILVYSECQPDLKVPADRLLVTLISV